MQRVEAQLRRDPLRSLGVETVEDAIARAGAVWAYVAGKWLRLCVAGSDSNRARWGLDPRWQAVQAAGIAAGVEAAQRVQPDRGVPNLDDLVPMLNGLMVSAGARLGFEDPAQVLRYIGMATARYRHNMRRDFAAEVQARRLDFTPSVA